MLIADDHVMVREGLAAIIGRQPDMQRWSVKRPMGSAAVAFFGCNIAQRDPARSADAVAGRHRQWTPFVTAIALARIVVLFDTDNRDCQAIKSGAKGYLLKDAAAQLLECIRKVHGGEACMAPALVAKLAAGISGETLTGRELDVLALLARGKEQPGNRRCALHQRNHGHPISAISSPS